MGSFFFLKIAKVLFFKKFYFIESTFLCGVHTTVEKRRTGNKMLTFKWLMLYSKYFQIRDRKKP